MQLYRQPTNKNNATPNGSNTSLRTMNMCIMQQWA